MAAYDNGIACLQENIALLTDQFGIVANENQPMWNISNALLVALDALRDIDGRLRILEQMLQR